MNRYPTVLFDVGGTFLRFDLEKLARVYAQASAARGVSLDLARTKARLRLVEAVQVTLRQLLSLLGIEAPEHM